MRTVCNNSHYAFEVVYRQTNTAVLRHVLKQTEHDWLELLLSRTSNVTSWMSLHSVIRWHALLVRLFSYLTITRPRQMLRYDLYGRGSHFVSGIERHFFDDTVVMDTFNWTLNNIQVTFLFVREKCKLINVRQNAKHLYVKYHGLLVYLHVVIIMKSCVKFLPVYRTITFVYITVTNYDALKWRNLRFLSKHVSTITSC